MRTTILGASLVVLASLGFGGRAQAQTDTTTSGPPAVPPTTTTTDTTDTTTDTTTATPPTTEEPEPAPVPDAPAPAADPLAPKLSGEIDGTYNYNFNNPAGGFSPLIPYTAKHNSFDFNQAHLAVTGNDDQFGYDVEVDVGSDAAVNSYLYGGNIIDVQEAWGTYTSKSGAGFKVGKFVTTEGIEVEESNGNPTISRGLLFTLAEPVSHVGALGTYKLNDQMDVALGLVNGWDLLLDNNSLRTVMAKFGMTTDKFLLTLSALAGPEEPGDNKDMRLSFDATADVKMAKMDLWLQANSGMEQKAGDATGSKAASWFGVGVQPVYKVNDQTTLGARAEVFRDNDGFRTGTVGTGRTVFDVSVAPAYAFTPHLTLRAEARADVSSDKFFVPKSGAADAKSFQAIATTEALVTF